MRKLKEYRINGRRYSREFGSNPIGIVRLIRNKNNYSISIKSLKISTPHHNDKFKIAVVSRKTIANNKGKIFYINLFLSEDRSKMLGKFPRSVIHKDKKYNSVAIIDIRKKTIAEY